MSSDSIIDRDDYNGELSFSQLVGDTRRHFSNATADEREGGLSFLINFNGRSFALKPIRDSDKIDKLFEIAHKKKPAARERILSAVMASAAEGQSVKILMPSSPYQRGAAAQIVAL